MAIRKRSALLLGILGFFSGVAFAQYQRKRLQVNSSTPAKPLWAGQKASPAVPMQVMDESLSTARKHVNNEGYTTH